VRLDDKHDRNKRAQLVAYLLSHGISQSDVPKMLEPIYGKAPVASTIASDKDDAETNGWLQHRFISSGIADDDLKWILALGWDYSALSRCLTSKSKDDNFQNLYVCYSGDAPAEHEPKYWPERIARFSQSASHFFERLLLQSKGVLGVSWGRTVAAAVHAMPVWENKERDTSNWIVVPTSGDPVGKNITGDSSTDVAEDLATILHCKAKSLRGVFATIPEELMPSRAALFEFFSRVADFEEVLGEGGLFRRLDTFITSVGNFAQESRIYTGDLIKVGGRTREELNAIAVGDIGGPLIRADPEHPDYTRLCESGQEYVFLVSLGSRRKRRILALPVLLSWPLAQTKQACFLKRSSAAWSPMPSATNISPARSLHSLGFL
jgi:hypothetical protein